MPRFPVRRLTCPKCGGQFDYEFVPGGSVTAVRLGTSRYLRCPLCHRFATFRVFGEGTRVPDAEAPGGTLPTQVRRFSDVRATLVSIYVVIGVVAAILVVTFYSKWPEPGLTLVLGLVAGFVVVFGILVWVASLQELPTTSPPP
jgi:hypothetical protein